MNIEDQKFMAFEGIRSWAQAILVEVERINSARKNLTNINSDIRLSANRQFQAERHLFLVAANKLMQYIDWAKKLNFLDKELFSEIEKHREDIKDMRDLNEHAIEYFIDQGRFKEKWLKVDEASIADASSTVDDRIGNRLSWNAVSAASAELLEKLPSHYWPQSG